MDKNKRILLETLPDDVLRQMMSEENTVLNHRMTWMWTLQGLLFTSIGFLWDKSPMATFFICITGVVSCLSIGFSLHCGVRAIHKLERSSNNPSTIIGLESSNVRLQFLLPWNLLPIFMGSIWVGIGLIIIFQQ